MTFQPLRFALVTVATLAVLAGCKDQEKCDKARNAAADAWKAVTETASHNKLAPQIGIDELAADKKAEHVQVWSTIEKQSDMIASSFSYAKITWNTADPALQKATAAFDGYSLKEQFKSFQMQLKDATDKYKATADACKE
jgi:hypothetical protein